MLIEKSFRFSSKQPSKLPMSAAAFVKLDKIICVFLTEILENFVLSIFLIDILMFALWLICLYAYMPLKKSNKKSCYNSKL